MRPGSGTAILIVAVVAAAAISFAVFCLADLKRSPVRNLPKWAWAVIICVSIPWGGLVYLILGRDRTKPAGPDPAPPAPPPELKPSGPRRLP